MGGGIGVQAIAGRFCGLLPCSYPPQRAKVRLLLGLLRLDLSLVRPWLDSPAETSYTDKALRNCTIVPHPHRIFGPTKTRTAPEGWELTPQTVMGVVAVVCACQ